jgi:hypothetical protein
MPLATEKYFMPTTAHEVFRDTVCALPPTERLRLASLILNDLAQSSLAVVDVGDTWTEQDRSDLMASSLQYAAAVYPEEQELA